MRKLLTIFSIITITFLFTSNLGAIDEIAVRSGELDISEFSDYQKEYETTNAGVCSASSTKTYMDYRAITSTGSRQYRYIRQHMTVDAATGFLYDEDGFIGVATGSYYGRIGDRFYFTLSNGNVIPVVKIDEKSDAHTINGCAHASDGSVMEFVIHKGYAVNSFALSGNGLISSGNYNNNPVFRGKIVKVEKVTGVKNPNYVDYHDKDVIEEIQSQVNNQNIFEYASGY